jgi:integrase
MFAFGVEHNYLKSSPIRKGLKSEWPETEAKPYSSDEMNRMEENCDDLRLAFLLLKWTGLRRSDAAEVTWSAIDWSSQTLRWRTKKRRKTVTIPLHPELLAELSINRKADGPILGMTAPQLYTHIKRLGEKAQIKDCHPHRFRCTLAVTMLQNGATLYEVAQILGDESATVEKHYAAFTDGLQKRVREVLSHAE